MTDTRGLSRQSRPGVTRVLAAHPGAELYGSDRMFLASVAGLAQAGCEVHAVLPGPGPLVRELELLGATVHLERMPVLRKAALGPRGLLGLTWDALAGAVPAWRLVRRFGAGGVYVSTVTIPLWLVVARLLGRASTVHVHEAETTAPRWVQIALALPLVLAQRVIVNSDHVRRALLGVQPRVGARSVLVPNGVSAPASSPPPREHLDGGARLLYVGRLSARKGPQVAVDTLAELIATGVTATLTLVGAPVPGAEGFEAELRSRVEQAGVGESVRFVGFSTEVPRHLAQADVVLVPSLLDEPFGNTAVEAVMARRPVVVSDAGGLPEAVAGCQSARCAAPGDVGAWAAAVRDLLDDWSGQAAATAGDADRARARHDPAGYARIVARIVRGEL